MNNRKFPGVFTPLTNFYLAVILILLLAITYFDWRIALPGYALFIILVILNLWAALKRRKDIIRYMEDLTFNIDKASKDTLLNFPLPLVIAERDGSIIWCNLFFRRLDENDKQLEYIVKTLSRKFDSELSAPLAAVHTENNPNPLPAKAMTESNPNPLPVKTLTEMGVEINGKHFNVFANYVKVERRNDQTGNICLMYFIDVSPFADLKKRYNEEKACACIIVIDNYDELMQSVDDSFRAQLLAEIDRRVNSWTAFTVGIIRKFERDKYFLFFEQRFLKEMEDKKFDLLDSIKEIKTGGKIKVTLSLGFGLNSTNLAGSFKFAGASIDIALGRGGDQAVIKNGDAFSFYGGRTKELEKRTRVKARVMAHALKGLIDESSMVVIMGHENPDPDCIGAALGIYRMAKSSGKETYIVLTQPNANIEALMTRIMREPEYKTVFIVPAEALNLIDDKTLLVIVDTQRPSFTESPAILKKSGRVVVVDHHRRGAEYIQDTVLTYQETYASSTCELVAELLQYADENTKLKTIEAEALFTGIVVDTKNFMFKAGVRTFEAASFLRKQGVDTVAIKQLFQNDIATYNSISSVVKAAEIINGNIAISFVPPATKNPLLIAAKAADELLTLASISSAFVLCQGVGEVAISGRSLGDVNVQMILEKLGGGGHLSVAGAQLPGIPPEEAMEKLKAAITEYFSEQAPHNF
ncbi:MAG: DHH family phosphoesterase [Clostridiales bacterium]|nr:DHH family phosphoesterase [Clostridiales bacterium]